MAKFPGFIGSSYKSASVAWQASRAINLYLEADESQSGKEPKALIGTPGIHLFTTLPTSPIRGFWAGHSDLLVVAGDHFYEVAPDGSYTDIGNVGDDAGHSRAQVFANGTYTVIISAGNLYVWDGVTLTQPTFNIGGTTYTDLTIDASDNTKATSAANPFTDEDVGSFLNVTSGAGFTVQRVGIVSVAGGVATFAAALGTTSSSGGNATQDFGAVTASMGAYITGYFVALKPNTNEWYISQPLDPLHWDPLDFAEKTSSDDSDILAIWGDHAELYVIGYKTIEVWRVTGNGEGGFPFEMDPGATVQEGTAASWAVESLQGGVVFLSEDNKGRGVAYRLRGFQPERISTHGVEKAWASYPIIYDAESFVYTEGGHEFWVINFPTANTSWAYDATASADLGSPQWHERAWQNTSGPTGHVNVNGRNVSYVSGDQFTEQMFSITIGGITYGTSPKYTKDITGIGIGLFDKNNLVLSSDAGIQNNVAYTSVSLDRQRQRVCGFWISLCVCGDRANGKIYHQSLDYLDDDGVNIIRRRTASPLSDEEKRMFGKRFQLEMESGNGAMTPILDWSDDRGHTYGAQHSGVASSQDDFLIRYLWRRLGMWFHRTWRTTITERARVVMTAADIDLEEGTV